MQTLVLRISMPLACLLIFCLALSVRAGEGAAETGPAAVVAAQGELAELPADAREALAAGRVVLLETLSEAKALGTRLVAVVDSSPEDVVATIRDYDAMKAFPEVRSLSASKGADGDTFSLTVKPHPLLPPMDFKKSVEWSLDHEGSARVGISLLSTTSKYVSDQQTDYRILPLDEGRSLVFLESRSSYAKLSFRKKVLKGMCESSEKWLADVRDRAAARRSVETPAAGGAVALLATGAVAAPLR
jgi:hypothetical protein